MGRIFDIGTFFKSYHPVPRRDSISRPKSSSLLSGRRRRYHYVDHGARAPLGYFFEKFMPCTPKFWLLISNKKMRFNFDKEWVLSDFVHKNIRSPCSPLRLSLWYSSRVFYWSHSWISKKNIDGESIYSWSTSKLVQKSADVARLFHFVTSKKIVVTVLVCQLILTCLGLQGK
jgi:hypothetical protein